MVHGGRVKIIHTLKDAFVAFAILSIPLALMPRIASAQCGFDEPINISGTPESVQAEVSIATSPVDADIMVIAGHHDNRDTLATWYTLDGGCNWVADPINYIDGYDDSDDRLDPSVAFGPDGTVYVGYVVNEGGDVPDAIICAQKLSMTGGFYLCGPGPRKNGSRG